MFLFVLLYTGKSNYDSVSGEIEIELEGSPTQLIEQCKGVIYALNIGSGAYQALNDITYTSEHHQYASYTNGETYSRILLLKYYINLFLSYS